MSRGAPRATRVVYTTVLTVLLLSHLVLASHQQQRYEKSLREGSLADTVARDQPPELLKGRVDSTRKNGKSTLVSNSASAIATLAPATLENAVRAPPAGLTGKSGISPLLNARSLQDWEVEDFVLLATVDGTIYARDRKTGAARWALEADKPMVETTYHRVNQSANGEPAAEDDFLWIVEPSRDGSLYIYHSGPNPSIQKLGMTVKKLVEELSPYAGEDPPVVYTAEKKSTLYTVDARSGKVLKMFSSGGSSVNDDRSCRRVSGLEALDDDECGSGGTLILGRTEYTVGIQSHDTGDLICTLKYWEWGPNNRDSDLHGQYVSAMDNKYVYSRHDGSIFSFGHERMGERRRLYTQKFSSPVVRVFDVARSLESKTPDAPLVILPQPIGPTDAGDLSAGFPDRDGRIFINCTENGGWYAMSETMYPFATGGAAPAQCYDRQWLETIPPWEEANHAHRRNALVGVHTLKYEQVNTKLPTLSGPEDEHRNDSPQELVSLVSNASIGNSRLITFTAENIVDIIILIPLLVLGVFVYTNKRKLGKMLARKLDVEKLPGVREALKTPPETPAYTSQTFPREVHESVSEEVRDATPPTASQNVSVIPVENKPIDLKTDSVRFEEPKIEEMDGTLGPPIKKKKTHRGNRGGVGRKKGKKDVGKDSDKDGEKDGVDRVLDEARGNGTEPTVAGLDMVVRSPSNGLNSNGFADVSGPFQINNLVVTDSVLGYGSHGTIVYRGSFEGKDVAVKRMLLEFFDVASHEVSLLQESDDHPNVIRYYCRQQSAGFLYIALELCPASLQDVIEKAHDFQSLVSLMDPPNVLYQITAGVRHLHSLKIVHRDLKPQNILVASPKIPRGRPDVVLPPRLLISDFGLCKKLDGDQSSFRATTAHAAGTSGWRAPELLVDDDASPVAPPVSESVGSTSEPAVIDTLSNRRATRAIDIFSLGCVFFYVLSGGSHPFGDRYMREANIVKGHYDLGHLQALGDYGHEARDLISRMINHNPRLRPDATTVMVHPFFWSPEKRLNFLVDVSDQFEFEPRDPPSENLQVLESGAHATLGVDFLKRLDKSFVDTLGKQRKYTGTRMLDLLRALRNKKNHYEDMPDNVKAHVGPLPEGYLNYWTSRFPYLLLHVYYVVAACSMQENPRFKTYFFAPVI
ncbi:MAG: bifunctional endoribonuclease/protein kinase ire1 [Trichoglossum hirsutum]|nr:MAG: bifunctional endoribonuclease/protein kinase ire1 [Trichoglossum hirsutum]